MFLALIIGAVTGSTQNRWSFGKDAPQGSTIAFDTCAAMAIGKSIVWGPSFGALALGSLRFHRPQSNFHGS